MMKNLKIALFALVGGLFSAAPAMAVTWYIEALTDGDPRYIQMTNIVTDGQFDTRVAGSFDYDFDTNTLSAVNLTVSRSGVSLGQPTFQFDGNYGQAQFAASTGSGPSDLTTITATFGSETDPAGAFVLTLAFAAPLLNTTPYEDRIAVVFATNGSRNGTDCTIATPQGVPCNDDNAGGFGSTANGTLIGAVTQVPVPAALPLMLIGMAGIGFAARRRRAA